MATLLFRSLQQTWPDTAVGNCREYSRFKATYADTLELLKYELCRIDVEQAVLELDFKQSDLRKNGFPPLGAAPFTARVRLRFHHPEIGHLDYPCDTYHDWRANVRAIALTLEAQRAMTRYGATSNAQQYRGWTTLPPREGYEETESDPTTLEEASELIAREAGADGDSDIICSKESYYRFCYKEAAKAAHPDSGGSAERFKKLQTARAILEACFAEPKDLRKTG